MRDGQPIFDTPLLHGAQGAEWLQHAIDTARAAAQRLQHRPAEEILGILDRLIAGCVERDSPWQQDAVARLAPVSGFSPAMLRHGLPLQLAPLRRAALAALLREELGSLERPQRGGAPLILHVLAGNLPALAAAPMLLSLALKLPVVLKPASGDPLSAGMLQQALAAVDPELAACVVVAQWRGGDRTIEDFIFAAADVVEASGGDAALAAIAPRVRGRWIGHAHRISFAAVDRQSLTSPQDAVLLARRLAYDVTLWDQQGCLSPQLCWLERGAAVPPRQFAEMLAAALEEYAIALPPRRHSLAEQVEIRRFRDEAEWLPGVELWSSRGSDAWTVRLEERAQFIASPLNRCLRLQVIDDLSALPSLLVSHRRYLEAAGIEVAPERAAAARSMLAQAGVHRVCDIGSMQIPGLEWRPGGQARIARWLR